MDLSAKRKKTIEVQTNDGAPKIALDLPIENGKVYHVKATVVAAETDGSNRASYELTQTYYNTGFGVRGVGGNQFQHRAESDTAWACGLNVALDKATVTVTGVSGATINWFVSMEWELVSA